MIISAVDDKYINNMYDDTMGYGYVTPLQLLSHLHTTYGTITADKINQCSNNLVQDWVVEDKVEDLWKRQE